MALISYTQNLEKITLWHALKHIQKKFDIEASVYVFNYNLPNKILLPFNSGNPGSDICKN